MKFDMCRPKLIGGYVKFDMCRPKLIGGYVKFDMCRPKLIGGYATFDMCRPKLIGGYVKFMSRPKLKVKTEGSVLSKVTVRKSYYVVLAAVCYRQPVQFI